MSCDRFPQVQVYFQHISLTFLEYKFAFNKYSNSIINSLGTPYDLKSIMHYEAYDFSKNRKVTIAAKQPGVNEMHMLSFYWGK